jgi:hypothetical protein
MARRATQTYINLKPKLGIESTMTLEQHREVAMKLAVADHLISYIATGEDPGDPNWRGGTYRYPKGSRQCQAVDRAHEALTNLRFALEEEAAQLMVLKEGAAADTHKAVEMYWPLSTPLIGLNADEGKSTK